MHPRDATSPAPGGRQGRTWARRLGLAGVLLWAAWLVLVRDLPRTCREELHEGKAVELCGQLTLTDPRVVIVAVIVGLLLIPEVAELELFGVLKLRREVEQQVGEVQRQVQALATTVNTVVATTSAATASPHQTVVVNPREEQVDEAIRDAQTEDPRDITDDEETGAFAIAAFKAGFLGLRLTLPAWGHGARLVGFRRDEAALVYLAEAPSDAVPDRLLAEVTALVNEVGSGTVRVGMGDLVVYAQQAAVPGRSSPGALAVIVDAADVEQVEDAEVGAQVDLLTGAYSVLLLDVLGQRRTLSGSASGTGGTP